MNTRTSDIQTPNVTTAYAEKAFDDEATYYPAQLDDEMGETAFHFKLISLFYNLLEAHFPRQENVTIAANMMVYYDKGNIKRWLAPDVFVAFGVKKELRRVFKVWEEGVFPQVVFEIASDSTFENDLGGKRLDYARLGVEEYYLLDPEREYLPSPLMAFHRQNGRLISANVENKRIVSPLLNLEIIDTDKSFRLFNPQTQEFLQAVLTGEE